MKNIVIHVWSLTDTKHRCQVDGADGRKIKTIRKILEQNNWKDAGMTYRTKGPNSYLFEIQCELNSLKENFKKMKYPVFFENSRGVEKPWNGSARILLKTVNNKEKTYNMSK